MAYIYEFAFLCTSLIDANRIMYYLGDFTEPGLGGVEGKIGDLNCFINRTHHSLHKNSNYDKSVWWVSVIPLDNNRQTRWPSNGPNSKKEFKEMVAFSNSVIDIIKNWSSRFKFEYACPGIEVTGFRDYDEIIDLFTELSAGEYNYDVMEGSIISNDIWNKVNKPNEFIKLNYTHRYIPYEGKDFTEYYE